VNASQSLAEWRRKGWIHGAKVETGAVNAFVGAMVGLERSIIPAMARLVSLNRADRVSATGSPKRAEYIRESYRSV
jgi:hypothetical protein